MSLVFQRARTAWAGRWRRLPLVRRFVRDRRGASAIEFGMVAAPFLALTFAIIETSAVFLAGQTLETAAADSARLIMTGQAQTQNFTRDRFKQEVCNRIYGLFDCQGGLHIDVRCYNQFAAIPQTRPVKPDGTLDTNFQFCPGGPKDIVVMRLIYEWPVYVSQLGLNLGDLSGGKRLMMATVAFRNEPF